MEIKPKSSKFSLNPKPYWLVANQGFTLIEIIVVISITVILAGILIGLGSRSRLEIELTAERARLGELVHYAESLAATGVVLNPNDDEPPCAYGLKIDLTGHAYSIFAYNFPAGTPCERASFPTIGDQPPNYILQDTYALVPRKMKFGPGTSLTYLVFLTLKNEVILFDENNLPSLGPRLISLENETGDSKRSITVNSSGQLSF